MEKEYHKLVRDRIPEIIRQSGNECDFVILSDPEYRQALRQKLIEEATEVAEADKDNLVAELADLYEVIDALMLSYGISGDRVLNAQAKRRETRGGFTKKIMLLRTKKPGF
ncbi:MAG: nucleoside triphosphate pyrophosphohydrolase [Microcoleus sp. PH2017_10_PVI_O_A]|uniref:nucleoside triphosphate pyrophosphohydrolase n=1 Tax=unclassified Microcoleus TaxID=2642155 RepID=UPI001DA07B8B|nr:MULTISPECIES: nucleoside triphosphate pyrophosphohydrolase [unclassified Microcoleus]TAE81540.1 MAG: nucleotide pyrophosphohydrolase [Oscillatoriales cyanobacterium]MCC3404947.1 nucleoside triphosphate pyrophosphohydrolase [Microcoleus sp. PH2017_10_PVI_O_A]MCC3461170.1 nucleoside triphosphate pyrophosphohydrolase [Microcoleus sp. PH2017_11_PCY_U_A]MCC3479124.1 nucleoside triphosphate pyrophosphohydrolase [Microcoleus sp. PH2017_12_PCY_D_A]MCC3527300.1 nucleoside triphosphate pyrophosphohyd